MQELIKALIKAKAEFLPVKKDTKGYGYKYAPLENHHTATLDALTKNGLVVTQTTKIENHRECLVTTLWHESGESIHSECFIDVKDIKDKASYIQTYGSYITYLRRYAYISILGIIGEDEDDDCAKTIAKPVTTTNSYFTVATEYSGKQINTEPHKKESLAQVIELLNKNNIKVLDFHETVKDKYIFSSKDEGSLVNLIENFDEILKYYKEKKNDI